MSLVGLPSALILVAISIVLDSESVLFVVEPIADVLV